MSPGRLRSHASYFKRKGYRFVRAGDLAQSWSEKTVCFSFDDAYWSTVEWGLPELDRLGVPGTLYAVTSLVGKTSNWDPSCPRPLAGWDALVSAQARGHEIGNHTHSHSRMSELTAEEQLSEIRIADEMLREHGITPGSFCYPYGAYDDTTVEVLGECGYGVGLALNKRVAAATDQRLVLPRIVVGYSDALPMLLYKIYLRPRLRRG